MDCRAVRELLAGFRAGRLAPDERAEVARHLEACADCRRAAAVETELDGALDRLPRHAAPGPLKRRLEALVASATPAAATASLSAGRLAAPSPAGDKPSRRSTWGPSLVSAFAAAALVLVVLRLTNPRPAPGRSADLVAEAVNDHLRVVSSTRPIEIESGGIHQVKPWFTGRLDFAPRVTFSGDADFPLVGGSVGYFLGRKAAVFVFKRRLHTITLLVFPPEGLGWPDAGGTRLGRLSVTEQAARGFSVLLWRDGGLGYALVSDVNSHDLETLASQINPD
jgi:anti-sigma factor RsiW